MKNRHVLFQLPFVLACLLALAIPAGAADAAKASAKPAMTLTLGGTPYLHRWSKDGQHEFTPDGQADLAKWRDMVTINVNEGATSAEKVAEMANRILAMYQQAGKIMKTASRPRTVDRPAEHLIVALFSRPGYMETAFARVMFVDGVGTAAIYSHRVYGSAVGVEMSTWLEKQGPDAERAIMGWDGMPKPAALAKLPTSP